MIPLSQDSDGLSFSSGGGSTSPPLFSKTAKTAAIAFTLSNKPLFQLKARSLQLKFLLAGMGSFEFGLFFMLALLLAYAN